MICVKFYVARVLVGSAHIVYQALCGLSCAERVVGQLVVGQLIVGHQRLIVSHQRTHSH